MQVTNDLVHVIQSEPKQPLIKKLSVGEISQYLVEGTTPIINTIRRVIIDETPTIAFDTAVVSINTSVIPDEVLCHRFAMVPIQVDPRIFSFHEQTITEENTLVFRLDITAGDEFKTVYSSDLEWIPFGNQKQRLNNVRPLIENIPLAKIAHGQKIIVELYAHKGIGKVHAKWSPVSACWFSMLPQFQYKSKIVNWENRKSFSDTNLKVDCPMNVFDDIEDIQLQNCTLCRKCLDIEGLKLSLDDTRYLLNIETTCSLTGSEILCEALNVIKEKSQLVINGLSNQDQ
ncbi:DNA-directed RNA polymerase subunit D [Spironucleus salmonicida]|uniref:DNA-directed RNA polymerase subunit D n=1 Tax=Spironucleus salmonicida TaxID=348837 RepID=V6LY42_9EUKA|nr:DNA-directed RNA polymerase subunit D [Spironucleus salmonicida]|eukprot:EST45704.1 DNA-directed RNA polymerase subunit D [Spironucleus salmonicida]